MNCDNVYHNAATSIQRAWRRHIDTTIYAFYRNLISFNSCGAPNKMLACINPIEAKLLDYGSKSHIKFRLAGSRFPPKVVYKIYTHAPIQDLCANSPKNYVHASNKDKIACQTNNNQHINIINLDEKNEWYKRVENNDWRCVSDRYFTKFYKTTQINTQPFHHDKKKRKQSKILNKRKQRINWLIKTYKKGKNNDLSHEKENELLERTKTFVKQCMENKDLKVTDYYNVDDDNMEYLIKWSEALDFEKINNVVHC
ncbi:hypothetical protein A3Q56_02611 [Intoshia linei]|uniref:Uncharacterized protein n=1 Tax=Intoshia linei TaxID=1819745 RepID=A0A177B5S4_9BILA|nr:hypothetical protein A3Q56_02611 [Intoshia linei]